MTQHDKNDLIEFARDHIEHFDAIPGEFETRSGEVIDYATIWNVCKRAGLTDLLKPDTFH